VEVTDGARARLPVTRKGKTKRIHLHYRVEGAAVELKIYVTTGEYEDGRLGEIFLKADKAGSTISGLLDALSITASLALQSGVPVETLVEKWERMQFAPAGTTTDPELPRVASIVDAITRWLRLRYCPEDHAATDHT
jgi:ribonucleoside-diphosphate reductase alpha chain